MCPVKKRLIVIYSTQDVGMIIMAEDSVFTKLFHPGSTVNLEYATDRGSLEKYDTIVEDVENEYLILRSPLDGDNRVVLIEEGRELTLRCMEDKVRQAYVTNVFVIEIRPGRIPLLVCCKPHKIGRTSLRRYSRFDVELPCSCLKGKISFEGRVVNISLSGCRVETPTYSEMPEGSGIEVEIEILSNTLLTFKGELVREQDLSSNKKSIYAVDITEINEEMHEVLKNYIFQCQLLQQ